MNETHSLTAIIVFVCEFSIAYFQPATNIYGQGRTLVEMVREVEKTVGEVHGMSGLRTYPDVCICSTVHMYQCIYEL
jgi:hypothetical protein